MSQVLVITGTDAEGRCSKHILFDDDRRGEIEVVEREARRAHIVASGAETALQQAAAALQTAYQALDADVAALEETDSARREAAIANLVVEHDIAALNVALDTARSALAAVRAEAAEIAFTAAQAAARIAAQNGAAVVLADPEAAPKHYRVVEGEPVLDTYVPPPPTILSYADFKARFDSAELIALVKYLRGVDGNGDPRNPLMLLAYEEMQARGTVNLENPETAAFLQQLADDGVLTEARRAEILGTA